MNYQGVAEEFGRGRSLEGEEEFGKRRGIVIT